MIRQQAPSCIWPSDIFRGWCASTTCSSNRCESADGQLPPPASAWNSTARRPLLQEGDDHRMNPFPASDPDRHAIWEMLVERDIQAFVAADWNPWRRIFLPMNSMASMPGDSQP